MVVVAKRKLLAYILFLLLFLPCLSSTSERFTVLIFLSVGDKAPVTLRAGARPSVVVYLRCLSRPFARPVSPLARSLVERARARASFCVFETRRWRTARCGLITGTSQSRAIELSARRDALPSSKLFLTAASALGLMVSQSYCVLDARPLDILRYRWYRARNSGRLRNGREKKRRL